MISPRVRWKAIVLSLLFPGLGHLYAGRPRLALWRFITAVVASFASTLSVVLWPAQRAGLLTAALVALGVAIGIAVDAGRAAADAGSEYGLRAYNRWYVYGGVVLVGALVWEVAVFSRIEPYRIPSGAMEPTLLIGDFIYARTTPAARRDFTIGSLVVFDAVDEPEFTALKRVAGMPGDTLAMVAGTFTRNGQPVVEPYVAPTDEPADVDPEDPRMRAWQLGYLLPGVDPRPYRPTLKNWGPLIVPPESVFVLGDNRDRSFDSRYYGFVGYDRIKGQGHIIYYSYDKNGVLPLPFLTAIRWTRIGTMLSHRADPPNKR